MTTRNASYTPGSRGERPTRLWQSNVSTITDPMGRSAASSSCMCSSTSENPGGQLFSGDSMPCGLTVWNDHSAVSVASSPDEMMQPVVCDTTAANSKLDRTRFFIDVSLGSGAAPLDGAGAGCFTAALEAIAEPPGQ